MLRKRTRKRSVEAALEMILRGFGFKKPDLRRSHHSRFIIDGKDLLIPFNKIRGIGDNVAKSIVQKREVKMFTSIEDLMTRAKVTKAQVEVLKRLGVLDGLPETDQASLF